MKIIRYLMALLLLLLFVGCSQVEPVQKPASPSDQTSVHFSNSGKPTSQQVPLQPNRVVVIGDTGMETLLHFGVEDSIVGIAYLNHSFSKYQKQIDTLPVINRSWASKEAILLLEPDLIISIDSALESERCGTINYWNQKGIPVIGYSDFTKGMSLTAFQADVKNIMTPFQKSSEVSQYFENWIPSFEPLDSSPDILFLSASPTGFYYFAPSWCLISDIILDVGGNYVSLSDQQYLEVSTEALLEVDPPYIVLTEHLGSDPEAVKARLTEHPLLKNLSAVKNNRLLVISYTASIQGNFDVPEVYGELLALLGGALNE